jgi:hypothetical protein
VRKIDDGAWIDDAGQLWIEEEGQVDLWAPPGSPAPVKKRATGCFFLDVPIYGWPLGVIWKNNPLQFASAPTANLMAKVVEMSVPGAKVIRYIEEVKVGPFSWRDKWMLSVTYGGKTTELNAGLEASTCERDEANYAAGLKARLV